MAHTIVGGLAYKIKIWRTMLVNVHRKATRYYTK